MFIYDLLNYLASTITILLLVLVLLLVFKLQVFRYL